MKKSIIAIAIAITVALAGSAHAGYISLLGEDGQVWKVDTESGAASKVVKYTDPGGSAEEQYSPNALGVSRQVYFYTNYNVSGADTLFRNGTALTTLTPGEPYNIANGDAVGSNFYFVDRNNGKFWTIGNIFGAASANAGVQINNFSGATMGDIAIKGTTAYLSTDSILATFDINNPGAGFTKTFNDKDRRYVGLGFDGDSLYGVLRAGDNNFDLYNINTATLEATKVADITGISGNGAISGRYEITDASRDAAQSGSPVPVPPAVWLLGSGLVGLAGLKRKIFG